MSIQHRKIILKANNVGFEDRMEFLLIWFADEDANPCQYLMLQRAREFDEQDRALGMDDIYIERDDQGWSAYGGILRFELHNDRAYVKLDDCTATKIGGVSEIEVRFNPGPAKLRELAAGLQLVFDGLNCFANHASTLVPPNHEGSQKG